MKQYIYVFKLGVLHSAGKRRPLSLILRRQDVTMLKVVSGSAGDMRVKNPAVCEALAGNPTIISEYMPGGGGRKAANHIYRSVKPDGLTLGNLGAGFLSSALLGETGVQYDIDRFVYLGTPYSAAHYLFLAPRDRQLGSLEKLRAAPGIRIGAQSVGHTTISGRLFSAARLKEPKFITLRRQRNRCGAHARRVGCQSAGG